MENKFITYSVEHSVGKITLNRPDVLNCFHRAMAAEVQNALDDCILNRQVRAVYLTGAGRAFSAGQDLKEAMTPGVRIIDIVRQTYNPIITKIRNIEKPVVCGVNGIAAGAGANVALSCDIVVAAKSATFVQAFSKIGLVPDSGGTFFLPRLVGFARANAMVMMDEKLTAAQAQQYGLIYKVLEDEKFQDEAFAIALKLSGVATRALGLSKRLFNQALFNNLHDQLELEADVQSIAASSHDHKEGVNAFIEKRKLEYKGE